MPRKKTEQQPRKKWGKYSYYRERPVNLAESATSDTQPAGDAPPSIPPASTGNLPYARIDGTKPLGTLVVPNGSSDKISPHLRSMVAKVLSLRATGMKNTEIAEALGVKPNTVAHYMSKAGKEGLLTQTNPNDRLEYEIPHKIVNNIVEFLSHQDDELRWDATKEVAKGVGMLKQHQAIKQEGGGNVAAISVQVIMPEGVEQPVVDGSIGGVEADYSEVTNDGYSPESK